MTSSPTLGSGIMEWKSVLQGTYGPNMNAFWWVAVEIWTFGKLWNKTWSLCDGNADADNRGDCNSSPCTSYRRAKNGIRRWRNAFDSKCGCLCIEHYFTFYDFLKSDIFHYQYQLETMFSLSLHLITGRWILISPVCPHLRHKCFWHEKLRHQNQGCTCNLKTGQDILLQATIRQFGYFLWDIFEVFQASVLWIFVVRACYQNSKQPTRKKVIVCVQEYDDFGSFCLFIYSYW